MTDTFTPVLTDAEIEQALDAAKVPEYPGCETVDIQIARVIERAAIEGYQRKIIQPSGFGGKCWQCWPKLCKCLPSPNEVESIKAERYLLDRELQRENRRAREFAIALSALESGIYQHRERLLAEHGLDGVPADLHKLGEQAKQAATLMDEPRNADRVSELYKKLPPSPEAQP